MAFPTGPVDNGTLHTDEYGNVFKYDAITGSWEKYLGDEFGEPVLTSGATMFGDLVQTPSTSVRPQFPGELAINRVDDTKVQFRYMGSDFAPHGVDMDFACIEEVTQELLITSQSVSDGNVFAQFGEVLEAQQDGRIVGGDPAARTFMWERSDEIAEAGLYIDTGITTETYTVLESDRGKYLRRRDTWSGTGTCGGTFVQRSNPMPVVFQIPTPTAYMAFDQFGGTGSLVLTLTGPALVYKIDSTGAWESIENFAAGTRTISFNNADRKTIAFQSENMTHFKWVANDDTFDFTIDSRSLTPALTSLYQSFANQPKYNQNVNFLQTSNVSNMDEAFANSELFNGNVTFNVSNVTTARSAFHNCVSFSQSFTYAMPNLVQGNAMFRNCENITAITMFNMRAVTNVSFMFENCRKFNGQIGLSHSYNLTNVAKMLSNCSSYTGNQDSPRDWQLGEVTNAHGMFQNCRVFNANISGQNSAWRNMPKLRDASYMFLSCRAFNQYDLKEWRWPSCNSFRRMFDGCSNLRADVTNMATASAKDMTGMFDSCLEIIGLGSWSPHVQNVESMHAMFADYQHPRLYGIKDWDTQGLEEYGLKYFLYRSNAWENMNNWRVERILEKPEDFAGHQSMQYSNAPRWGKKPPTFAYTPKAGASQAGRIENITHPDRVSGEGQPGDVIIPKYEIEGGTVTKYEWHRSGQNDTSVHPENPGTAQFTISSGDRGRSLWCIVTGTAPDHSKAKLSVGVYYVAGSATRAQSATSYSVTTVDNERGESVVVNLQFTGVDPIEYFKMSEDGEFELVGEMQPGSPKSLTLPQGVYAWEAVNMTSIDYSGSPEETEVLEHSTAYNPTV